VYHRAVLDGMVERHVREASFTDAACLYCFAPLDAPGYCSDTHKAADRKHPKADVLAGVLDEFATEPILPGPDQIAMF
jgi:hypothetical protein